MGFDVARSKDPCPVVEPPLPRVHPMPFQVEHRVQTKFELGVDEGVVGVDGFPAVVAAVADRALRDRQSRCRQQTMAPWIFYYYLLVTILFTLIFNSLFYLFLRIKINANSIIYVIHFCDFLMPPESQTHQEKNIFF